MSKDCGCSHAKCNNTPKGKMCPKHGMDDCSIKEDKDPCWKGYTQVGMKKKGGREVPNCVPSKGVPKAKGYKKEDFIPEDHKEIASGKKKDEEGYMARNELDTMERAIANLRKVVRKGDTQLPAWVQSKITKAADYIDTAADYLQSDDPVREDYSRIQQYGQTYTIILTWHASTYKLQVFFPKSGTPTRQDVEDAIHKVYPGALLNAYMPSRIDPTKPMILTQEEVANEALAIVFDPDKEKKRKNYLLNIGVVGEESATLDKPPTKEEKRRIAKMQQLARLKSAAKAPKHQSDVAREEFEIEEDWQSVNRKDKTDGLSQKAVNAYRRENPGSKLQTAVTEKKLTGKRAKRRKSFCRRMKGMKSKLTSAKTARDPDSRINKALRRWNCS